MSNDVCTEPRPSHLMRHSFSTAHPKKWRSSRRECISREITLVTIRFVSRTWCAKSSATSRSSWTVWRATSAGSGASCRCITFLTPHGLTSRVWQTQGLGTALKLLLAAGDEPTVSASFILRRNEVVALVNVFARCVALRTYVHSFLTGSTVSPTP